VGGDPWSGFGLAVGSVTLAGLPPTAGFVSEWFLLESLMQQFRVPGLGYRLVLALAGAAVALTAGFAGVTFVRLVGLIVLGRRGARGAGSPRRCRPGGSSPEADRLWLDRARGGGRARRCCLAIAAVTRWRSGDRRRAVADVPSALTMGALKSPWVLQPVFAGSPSCRRRGCGSRCP